MGESVPDDQEPSDFVSRAARAVDRLCDEHERKKSATRLDPETLRWCQRECLALADLLTRTPYAEADAAIREGYERAAVRFHEAEKLIAGLAEVTRARGDIRGLVALALDPLDVSGGRQVSRTECADPFVTTVEDQKRADFRIPYLLELPAPVRFLSCEPLLGPVDFRRVPGFNRVGLDLSGWWVIAGGESGPGARPMHPDWPRRLRDLCAIAGVPFFFKQWGEHDSEGRRIGKKAAGALLDGVEHKAFPRTVRPS